MQFINLPLFDRLPAEKPAHSLAEQTMPLSGADLGTKVQAALQAIKRLVRQDKHLAVAWSGGKDSSVTLNLALTALRELAAEGQPLPPLHVMHSDTRLENPVIHAYNKRQIARIEQYSQTTGIPVRVWVASPGLSNDYLVSLIGGRTIASVGPMPSASKCSRLIPSIAPSVPSATTSQERSDESVQRTRLSR